MTLREPRIHWLFLLCCGLFFLQPLSAQDQPATESVQAEKTVDEKINEFFEPATKAVNDLVFYNIYTSERKGPDGKPALSIPFILIWLGGSALFLTFFFRFINFRAFGLALRTVRGKYSKPDDPGEITHFQALSSAVSATVGLGNIAGVAIAINMGGPGAMFWIIVMGLLGMTSKFAECTLGLKYRHIDKAGKVLGGPCSTSATASPSAASAAGAHAGGAFRGALHRRCDGRGEHVPDQPGGLAVRQRYGRRRRLYR